MVDAGRVDDARRVAEALAIERRRGHVQRLVVESLRQGALLEVAADDRNLVDRRDRRHAQAAERRDQPAPRGVGERQVVDRGREDVRDLLRDQLLGGGHADEDRLLQRADRGRGLLAERGVRLVADHELVGVAVDLGDVAREPGVRLDRDRVRRARLPSGPRGSPRSAGRRSRARCSSRRNWSTSSRRWVRISTPSVRAASTKPGGRDRLAGRGRVAEAVAPDRAEVLADHDRLRLRRPRAPPGRAAGRRRSRRPRPGPRRRGRSPFSSSFWFAAISSVSMPGERVDLVAAQLGARGEARGLVRQHPLEAEHQRVADAPGRRGRLQAARPSPRARRRAPGGGRCRAREPPRDPRRDGGTAHPPRLRRGGRRR